MIVPPAVGVVDDSVTAYCVAEPAVTANELDVPVLPFTVDDAPDPPAVRVTPDSTIEYTTPAIVTLDEPTAIVPVVVPLNVPVPAERDSDTEPLAPALTTALPYVSVKVTVTENGTPAIGVPTGATNNFEATPASTVKVPDASVVDTAPEPAEIVCDAPAIVGVIETLSTNPLDEIVALTVPENAVELSVTVPE